MIDKNNPGAALQPDMPPNEPGFLELAASSHSSRLLRLIERVGMGGSIFLACAALSAMSVALASLAHYLTGDPIGVTGLLNTTIIPFVLGVPTLIAVFSLLQRLEATRAELARLSTLDMLTGALNRRSVIAWGEVACHPAPHETPLPYVSVALMDVDRFKQVNDEHGHLIGDETLRQLCRAVKRHLPPQCHFGRYGGEEFAVIMPQLKPQQAEALAELLREAVQADCARVQGHQVEATVSIGVASARAGQGELADMLSRADEALYAAKRAGRNRVMAAAPVTPAKVSRI